MKIRTGFDIAFESVQPTPMILALSVHPSRMPDVITPHVISFDPPIPCQDYRDGFDNICTRIVTPPGRLTISADFIVQDSGLPDAYAPYAQQIEVQNLPNEVLVYLLGSRYCDTDKLSETAWSLFGGRPRAGAACRRSATTCTTASASTTCAPTPPAPPGTASCSARASAATSRISPSPSAAA